MKEIMPWLFKDPIVAVAWLNFDTSSQVFNKWPKKIKLTQLRFFLKKQLIKFSCTSWSLLLCKIIKMKKCKKTAYPKFWGHHTIFCTNDQTALNKISFRKTINIISMTLIPFIVQSCKRILTTDPELLGRMRHSGFQMVYLSQTRFFLKKSLIKLQCTISPIYCAKFLKKLLAPIQSFEDVPFLSPKCPICPKQKIFDENH